MRNISSAFDRALLNDKRDYQSRLVITLADSTVINVDNSRLWEGGLQIDDAVSADNVFQIGAAIINQGTFILNNIYDDYDEYSFDGATVVAFTGLTDLDDGTSEEIRLGTYIVDETKYNGSLITLTCLDKMSKFDKVYDSTFLYPATLFDIVSNACTNCGVSLATSSLNFPHSDYIVSTKPSGENTTYRQVISWTAQIAGCFARCNVYGELELRWYNTSEFDIDGLDGGIFDGADTGWLVQFMDTDEGMTSLFSGTADDQWFYIDNSIGFKFNNSVSDRIYIDSDSCYTFTNSTPSSHGHSRFGDVNVCTRDGQVVSIKYQEITVEDRMATKVRFHGYTRYGASYQTRAYEIEYEIFFTDNEEIVINFIKLPTNDYYIGTSRIIENAEQVDFIPKTDKLSLIYREDNEWIPTYTTTSYETGDDADGGSFDPWDTGDAHDGGTFHNRDYIHFLTSSYTSNISTDNVVITGIKVIKKVKTDGGQDSYSEYTSGTAGYVIVIENNDFIDGTHGADIAAWLGTQLIGLSFRKAELTHPNNPSIEAGDVAVFFDLKGNHYPILVSSTRFAPGDSQRTVSSAETPAKNSAKRFTESSRNYVELRQRLSTTIDDIQEEIEERIATAAGLYCTEVPETGGGSKIYYHNKARLEESDIAMLFTTAGFTLTANYQDEHPTWYGMTVDGQMIASILNASGVNADWINTGTLSFNRCSGGALKLGGANNGNGLLEIYGSDNVKYGYWNNEKLMIGGNLELSKTGYITTNSSISVMGSFHSIDRHYEDIVVYTTYSNGFIAYYDFRDTQASGNNRGQLWYMPMPRTFSTFGGEVSCLDMYASRGNLLLEFFSGIDCKSNFVVRQGFTKSKAIETQNYGERLLYCYETPTPYFGDIGFGQIDPSGECIVSIDDMLREGIAQTEYSVFLQKEGQGDLWVDEKDESYFIIKGTPGLKFSWELKAPQRHFEDYRLEDRYMEPTVRVEDNPDCGLRDLDEYLQELDTSDDNDLSLTQLLDQLDAEYAF